jgi:hypothetical protein
MENEYKIRIDEVIPNGHFNIFMHGVREVFNAYAELLNDAIYYDVEMRFDVGGMIQHYDAFEFNPDKIVTRRKEGRAKIGRKTTVKKILPFISTIFTHEDNRRLLAEKFLPYITPALSIEQFLNMLNIGTLNTAAQNAITSKSE